MKHMWSKEEINENVKNLYKHSFVIRGSSLEGTTDLFFDIVTQSKKAMAPESLSNWGAFWTKVKELINNRFAYIYNVSATLTDIDEEFEININDIISLSADSTSFTLECVGVYTSKFEYEDAGNTQYFSSHTCTLEVNEEIIQYYITDCNTGEELYFREI